MRSGDTSNSAHSHIARLLAQRSRHVGLGVFRGELESGREMR
jgi:hypothetical protein